MMKDRCMESEMAPDGGTDAARRDGKHFTLVRDGVFALQIAQPKTHQMMIEEFCQSGRLEIKFGRMEII